MPSDDKEWLRVYSIVDLYFSQSDMHVNVAALTNAIAGSWADREESYPQKLSTGN